MSCLGVHFALTEAQASQLQGFKSDSDRLAFLQEEIEERFFNESPELAGESDKAWDAIHRCLTDGKLAYDNGEFPLSHVILGGAPLYYEDDYIMSLKNPEEVRKISAALRDVTEQWLREQYIKIPEQDYGVPLSDEGFQYTWEWLANIKDLYAKAAENNRPRQRLPLRRQRLQGGDLSSSRFGSAIPTISISPRFSLSKVQCTWR